MTTRCGPGCPEEAVPWRPTPYSSGSLSSRVSAGVGGPSPPEGAPCGGYQRREPWPAAQLWVGRAPGPEALLACRAVPLGADALLVHHAGPDRCLAEADLPAAHGKDQAGAGALPALRAGCGAGGQFPEAPSFSWCPLSAHSRLFQGGGGGDRDASSVLPAQRRSRPFWAP